MGNIISSLLKLLKLQKKTHQVLVVGLDDSGKTSIVNRLKEECEQKENHNFIPIPSVDPTFTELVCRDETKLVLWDVPGMERKKYLVDNHVMNRSLVIFVIDARNKKRLLESKVLFYEIINTEELKGVPIMILSNKHDGDDPKFTDKEIVDTFKLEELKVMWLVLDVSVVYKKGFLYALEWMRVVATKNTKEYLSLGNQGIESKKAFYD